MSSLRRLRTFALAAVLIPAVPVAARAAPDPNAAKIDEAKTHFSRAISLYDDGEYEASRLEFERSYELNANPTLFYNLGLVAEKQREYAKALTYFERFVAEAKPTVVAPRHAEVSKAIERLATRVGKIHVRSNVPKATVLVDDRTAGAIPNDATSRATVGQHRVTLQTPEGRTQTRVVDVTSGDTTSVDLPFPTAEPPRTIIVPRAEEPPRKEPDTTPMVIGWITTGVLAAGAGALGALSLGARSDLDQAYGSTDSARIDRAESRLQSFALATDIAVGAALVAAGVSTYLTIRPPLRTRDRTGQTTLSPTIGGAILSTRF